MKRILFTFLCCLCVTSGYVQNDSIRVDSLKKPVVDTTIVIKSTLKNQGSITIDSFYRTVINNPFVKEKKPIFLLIDKRQKSSKDELFYLAVGLLLVLAFNRLVFSKYFANIFRLFFQPTFRQKQTREQLLQNNLPSLLYNLLFIFSAAAYVALIADYYKVTQLSFWILFLYSAAIIAILYFFKYFFLRFSGWLFNVKEATTTYIFLVYLINKISGIILIPFIILIAFSNHQIATTAVVGSLLILLLLFAYRYIISYGPVRKEIKVSPIHFFFYISAFEIVPILIIYKVLMIYMDGTL